MHSEKEEKKYKHSSGLYVLNMVIVYALWKAFAYYVKHSNGYIANAWGRFIHNTGAVYASVTSALLNFFGQNTMHYGIGVYFLQENKAVTIEDHCLAIPATIIFVGTIVLFKGAWQNKVWFIIMGVAFIIILNLIRLVLLCYIFAHYTKQFFDINHSLVYVVITYTLIFLLIVLWMQKFAWRRSR